MPPAGEYSLLYPPSITATSPSKEWNYDNSSTDVNENIFHLGHSPEVRNYDNDFYEEERETQDSIHGNRSASASGSGNTQEEYEAEEEKVVTLSLLKQLGNVLDETITLPQQYHDNEKNLDEEEEDVDDFLLKKVEEILNFTRSTPSTKNYLMESSSSSTTSHCEKQSHSSDYSNSQNTTNGYSKSSRLKEKDNPMYPSKRINACHHAISNNISSSPQTSRIPLNYIENMYPSLTSTGSSSQPYLNSHFKSSLSPTRHQSKSHHDFSSPGQYQYQKHVHSRHEESHIQLVRKNLAQSIHIPTIEYHTFMGDDESFVEVKSIFLYTSLSLHIYLKFNHTYLHIILLYIFSFDNVESCRSFAS